MRAARNRVNINEAARLMGKRGGAATKGISTPKKAKSSAKNGKLGGRPRDKKPSAMALAQRKSRERRKTEGR